MGDVLSLIEKAQTLQNDKEAEEAAKRMMANKFDMNDMLTQFAQIRKMGGASALLAMMPGANQISSEQMDQIDEKALPHIEAIIYSMTPEERSNPEILNGSRRTRIAKGSGTTIQEVNRLLKQFDQTRKMMKMVTGSKMGKMMPKMKR